MRYHADGYTEKYLNGGNAMVAYNPDDVSQIWALENGEYRVFDLIESRFRGKSLEDVENLKADCREMIKNAAGENLQAKIDLAEHIRGIAGNVLHSGDTKVKDIRRTRKKEQRKVHVDFLKGGAVNE